MEYDKLGRRRQQLSLEALSENIPGGLFNAYYSSVTNPLELEFHNYNPHQFHEDINIDISFILDDSFLPFAALPLAFDWGIGRNLFERVDRHLKSLKSKMGFQAILDRIDIGILQDGSGFGASWPKDLGSSFSISIEQWFWWRCWVHWGADPLIGVPYDTSLGFSLPDGTIEVRRSNTEYKENTASRVHVPHVGSRSSFSDMPALAGKQLNDIIRNETMQDIITQLDVEYNLHTKITITYNSEGVEESESIDNYWRATAHWYPDMRDQIPMECEQIDRERYMQRK